MNKGLLVNKVEGYELSASDPDTQTNAVTFQIKGGLETVNLSEISSGSVSGFANFVQGTLSNLGQRLNNIVTVMSDEVNAIQVAGLDGEGKEGVAFFALEPGVDVDKGASRGDYDVTPAIQSLDLIENGTYSFTYDFASQGWIPDAGQSINATADLGIPGLEFRIAGTPLDGDRFTVRVFDDAASGIRMGIRDGSQIAASSLFRVTPGPNNVGGNNVSINFEKPEQAFDQLLEDPELVTSSASDPVSVISAGQSEVIVKLNPDNSSDLTIDILTSDGRHLVGEADTVELTSVVSQSSFFSTNATYSDRYLNKSGSSESSYKNLEVGFGAFGETSLVTQLLPMTGNAISAPTTTDFAGGFLDLTAGILDQNTVLELVEDDAVDETLGAISVVGDAVYRGTGSGSEQIASINYPYGLSSPSFDTLRVTLLGDPVDYNFENASFEDDAVGSTTITGWTTINEQIKLGESSIAGYVTPDDLTIPTSSAGDSVTATGGTFSTEIVSDQASVGDQSVRMQSTGLTSPSYGVVHGPAMYTDSTVALKPGDTISFDWKAQNGSDAYDVFGYFINETTGETYTVLDDTGGTTDWQTELFTATVSGDYRFVFVSGSYDESGGTALGASLYVDNLVVDAQPILPPNIDVSVINQIASRLSLSTGANLESSPYPVISNVSVEAVTQNSRGQFSEVYTFNSDDLIAAGRVESASQYRSELVGKDIPLVSGDGTSVIGADQLAINGVNLGALTVGLSPEEGYGRLSALDIKTWIDNASVSDVSVNVSNEIVIPTSGITLNGAGLSINGVDIVSVANSVSTVFDDVVDIAQSINAYTSSTGVGASILRDGGIRLSNTNGANIKISSSTDDISPNLLGISNGTYAGQYTIVQKSDSSSPLSIEILDGGGSSDLNAVGLDTSIILRGDIDEDLGVFVRGSGEASISSEQTKTANSFVSGLRGRVYEIEFTTDTSYTISDQVTGTLLAERTYAGETQISYQGMLMRFTDTAVEGDIFTIDGNNTAPGQAFDAQGNNSNLMRILDLESAGIVSGQSLTEAYLDLVGDVGNEATQAEISYEALEVLEAQATEARDRVSGVSLDREAADLIRFQQAYQASAQIIQIATKIFDDMLRIQ